MTVQVIRFECSKYCKTRKVLERPPSILFPTLVYVGRWTNFESNWDIHPFLNFYSLSKRKWNKFTLISHFRIFQFKYGQWSKGIRLGISPDDQVEVSFRYNTIINFMSHWEGMFFERETQNYLFSLSKSWKKNSSCDHGKIDRKCKYLYVINKDLFLHGSLTFPFNCNKSAF